MRALQFKRAGFLDEAKARGRVVHYSLSVEEDGRVLLLLRNVSSIADTGGVELVDEDEEDDDEGAPSSSSASPAIGGEKEEEAVLRSLLLRTMMGDGNEDRSPIKRLGRDKRLQVSVAPRILAKNKKKKQKKMKGKPKQSKKKKKGAVEEAQADSEQEQEEEEEEKKTIIAQACVSCVFLWCAPLE